MGTVEHVDRVELYAADILDEARETSGAERRTARPCQMLALEEQRPDGVQRDACQCAAPSAHRPGAPVGDLRGVLAIMRGADAVDQPTGSAAGHKLLVAELLHGRHEVAMRAIHLAE